MTTKFTYIKCRKLQLWQVENSDLKSNVKSLKLTISSEIFLFSYRLSVFFTTRTDGTLDVWDILQQQKQACLGVKVCDEPLRCLRTHDMGRLVAVGNQKGTTYLVEFSENLAMSNKNDKAVLTAVSILFYLWNSSINT